MRFIYACMAVVAISAAFMMTQMAGGGIDGAREDVLARNAPAVEPAAAPSDEGVSFEDIYANARAPEEKGEAFFSPEELNSIDTAAGKDFDGGFTDEAPKALKEPAQVAPAAPTEEPSAE